MGNGAFSFRLSRLVCIYAYLCECLCARACIAPMKKNLSFSRSLSFLHSHSSPIPTTHTHSYSLYIILRGLDTRSYCIAQASRSHGPNLPTLTRRIAFPPSPSVHAHVCKCCVEKEVSHSHTHTHTLFFTFSLVNRPPHAHIPSLSPRSQVAQFS